MICREDPQPLPKDTSASVVNMISKMLRKQSFHRPRTDQLVLCPYLVPYIVRVYMNLGRIPNTANQNNKNFGPEMFLKFVRSQRF